jgi:hypothetical protein
MEPFVPPRLPSWKPIINIMTKHPDNSKKSVYA